MEAIDAILPGKGGPPMREKLKRYYVKRVSEGEAVFRELTQEMRQGFPTMGKR